MTTTAALASRHRPPSVILTVVTLAFLGISALGGGIALTFGISAKTAPPSDWLDHIPVIDSWVVPGLVLGIVFGLGSLVTAYGVLKRPRWPWLDFLVRWSGHHWSWAATMVLGLGQVAWIILELIYLPQLSWLQAVFGATGIVLALLPWLPTVSHYLRDKTSGP